MDTFKNVLTILGVVISLLGPVLIGFIFWLSYKDWKAKGMPIDLDKIAQNLVQALVGICALVGFLVILDWLLGCSQLN